jgi:hypothetical protein
VHSLLPWVRVVERALRGGGAVLPECGEGQGGAPPSVQRKEGRPASLWSRAAGDGQVENLVLPGKPRRKGSRAGTVRRPGRQVPALGARAASALALVLGQGRHEEAALSLVPGDLAGGMTLGIADEGARGDAGLERVPLPAGLYVDEMQHQLTRPRVDLGEEQRVGRVRGVEGASRQARPGVEPRARPHLLARAHVDALREAPVPRTAQREDGAVLGEVRVEVLVGARGQARELVREVVVLPEDVSGRGVEAPHDVLRVHHDEAPAVAGRDHPHDVGGEVGEELEGHVAAVGAGRLREGPFGPRARRAVRIELEGHDRGGGRLPEVQCVKLEPGVARGGGGVVLLDAPPLAGHGQGGMDGGDRDDEEDGRGGARGHGESTRAVAALALPEGVEADLRQGGEDPNRLPVEARRTVPPGPVREVRRQGAVGAGAAAVASLVREERLRDDLLGVAGDEDGQDVLEVARGEEVVDLREDPG